MEGLRKILPKSGSTIDKKSETSQESIPIPMSARSKLSRLRQKIRMMSNMRGSKVLDRQQTNVAYENTYKLEPDTANRFSTNKAEQVIHEVFEHYLRGKSYEPKVLPRLIKTLSELIRDRVKAQGIERHKIIVTVTVIENKKQGVQVSSRALWNDKFDNYASIVYDGPNFYAVGSVYAVYYD
ncbi:unnamed protein product [Candidula unifasciata]|uniref:Uncharacterized protein n=1 Tax=Candidula unifasciata TaxID=100452 RepID=A0A8S3Z4K7_9EUPU|nr:unnamed protein product [Candidula unifasciata]